MYIEYQLYVLFECWIFTSTEFQIAEILGEKNGIKNVTEICLILWQIFEEHVIV